MVMTLLLQRPGSLGLQSGIGPFSANVGAAIVTYAQPKPTIRINILTACFMVCFSFHADPLGAGIHLGTNYIGGVNR